MTTSPLTIWVVSDGRAGIENQALGLAEAIARLTPADIVTKRIRYAPAFDRLPTALKLLPDAMLSGDSDSLKPPAPGKWPDIWISAGRATLPHALRMRKRSGGRTLVVQCQDPKADPKAFDIVIAPEHDGITGSNILALIGSTNRVTAERLAIEYAPWQARLQAFKGPRIAALIGGTSKVYDLSVERATAMALQIKLAVAEVNGVLLLTLSRRTPEAVQTVFRDVLKDVPGLIYAGPSADMPDNPYFAFLHVADYILVTEDSVNMATEAAVTGKPVHILAMDRLKPGQKFETFHKSLRIHGISRPFAGHLDSWAYVPLDETRRAAQHVLQVFADRKDEPGLIR